MANIDEAIKFLENKTYKAHRASPEDLKALLAEERYVRWRHTAHNRSQKLWRLWNGDHDYGLHTEREVIKFARTQGFGATCHQKKQPLKEFSKRTNRAATRQAISREEFDKIPNGKARRKNLVADEDPWSWD